MNKLLKKQEYKCPICEESFESIIVRDAPLKVLATDSDLRPYHRDVDLPKYEVVTCTVCGYSSLGKTFNKVFDAVKPDIQEKLKTIYKEKIVLGDDLTYGEAVQRFQLAINIAEERRISSGELFYLYFKLAWIFRVMKIDEAVSCEYICTKRAVEYGERAFEKESAPFVDLTTEIMTYLLGDLNRRLGNVDKAYRYINEIIVNRNINQRLRDRAMDQKETLKALRDEKTKEAIEISKLD